MKPEIGKYYKTKYGEIVGPMEHAEAGPGHVFAPGFGLYTPDGKFGYISNGVHCCQTPELDLIAPAGPEQGTLKEIGAKVGDVVRYEQWVPHGHNRTIAEITTPYWLDNYGEEMAQDSPYWRIISSAIEAPTSPIRTVTRTTKEIVPGVYGRLVITHADNNNIAAKFTHIIGEYAMLDVTELRAAAITLNEIADALDDNQ